MSDKKKHHHSRKSNRNSVDLSEQRVRYHGKVYTWKGDETSDDYLKWYRVSTHHLLRDGKKVPWVRERKRPEIEYRSGDSSMHDIEWEEIRHRVKDPRLIKRLNRLAEHAVDEQPLGFDDDGDRRDYSAETRDKAQEQERVENLRKAVLAKEEAELRLREADSDEQSVKQPTVGSKPQHTTGISLYKHR
jgi:hypothetical protein